MYREISLYRDEIVFSVLVSSQTIEYFAICHTHRVKPELSILVTVLLRGFLLETPGGKAVDTLDSSLSLKSLSKSDPEPSYLPLPPLLYSGLTLVHLLSRCLPSSFLFTSLITMARGILLTCKLDIVTSLPKTLQRLHHFTDSKN